MPCASSPLKEDERFHDASSDRASASTTSKPIECGVFAYSAPGLPSPAITFIETPRLRGYFFASAFLASASSLPFLMTSGDFSAAAAAAAAGVSAPSGAFTVATAYSPRVTSVNLSPS